jgi:hypothetical protein
VVGDINNGAKEMKGAGIINIEAYMQDTWVNR